MSLNLNQVIKYAREYHMKSDLEPTDEEYIIEYVFPEFKEWTKKVIVGKTKEYSSTLPLELPSDNKLYHGLIKTCQMTSVDDTDFGFPDIMTPYCRLRLFVDKNMKDIPKTRDGNRIKELIEMVKNKIPIKLKKLIDLAPEVYVEVTNYAFLDSEFEF